MLTLVPTIKIIKAEPAVRQGRKVTDPEVISGKPDYRKWPALRPQAVVRFFY